MVTNPNTLVSEARKLASDSGAWFRTSEFSDALDVLRKSVSTEPNRQVLQYVYLDVDENGAAWLAATNTHTLTYIGLENEISTPMHNMKDRVLLDPRTLEVYDDSKMGEAPYWPRVIPGDTPRSCGLDAFALLEALRYVKAVAQDQANRVRLTFSEDGKTLTVSASTYLSPYNAKASCEIAVKWPDLVDGFEIAVNFEYLRDVIAKATKSRSYDLKLEFTEWSRPFTLRRWHHPNYRAVIMPMCLE